MSRVNVCTIGEEWNGEVKIMSYRWVNAVEKYDEIDADGVEVINLAYNVNTRDLRHDFFDDLQKIVRTEGRVIVQLYAWMLPYGCTKCDNEAVELRLVGNTSSYSPANDPYSLYSKFTVPRRDESVSVWDCPREIDVSKLKVESNYYNFRNVVKESDGVVTVVSNTLFYPTLDDTLCNCHDKNVKALKELDGLVVVTHISGFCSTDVGYTASVWHANKLYTMHDYTEENLEKVVEMVKGCTSTKLAGTDSGNWRSVLLDVPMASVRNCETNEELVELIRRYM